LNIVNHQGQQFTLQIQDSEPDPMDTEGEVRLYTVNYQNPATSQWENICKPDAKGVAKAMPLSGRWDPQGNYIKSDQVTFSCTNGANSNLKCNP
jgi:ADYC domain